MKVVHCKKEPYDVYIGRTYGPLKDLGWGNPFVIGPDGDRHSVIRKYETYILQRPDLINRLPELKGKTLACWCSPLPCHGDVLITLCNMDPDKLKYWHEEFRKCPGYSESNYYNEIAEYEQSRYKVKE